MKNKKKGILLSRLRQFITAIIKRRCPLNGLLLTLLLEDNEVLNAPRLGVV